MYSIYYSLSYPLLSVNLFEGQYNENKKDIEEINPEYIKGMTFHYVNHIQQVLDIALTKQKVSHPFHFDIKTDENKKN